MHITFTPTGNCTDVHVYVAVQAIMKRRDGDGKGKEGKACLPLRLEVSILLYFHLISLLQYLISFFPEYKPQIHFYKKTKIFRAAFDKNLTISINISFFSFI